MSKKLVKMNENSENKKAVIYCRVSSREQEETGYSLPAQEKLLREYADRNGFDVVKVFSISESASGAKQRKIFLEMMKHLEKEGIVNLLCEKVDRLTRNMKDAVVVNDWIENDMRKVHFVKQNLVIHKNAKSDEKFRWDIEIVLAKKYIANLSEEVKKGQKEKLEQGWIPTTPPIGYVTQGDRGHKIPIIDESKAHYIVRAFEAYASENYSITAITTLLKGEGLVSRSGRPLVRSQIEKMFRETFYYGDARWNGVLYKGAHQPLIKKDLFDKVQNILTGRGGPSVSKRTFAFRKMIRCGECDGTITGEVQKGHSYYHCNHYRACTQKSYIREEAVEAKIFNVFEIFASITPEEATEVKAAIKADHAQEIEYKTTALKSLSARYETLQRRVDALYEDKLDGKISMEMWERKHAEALSEQKSIRDRMSTMKDEETKYFEIGINILDLAMRAREIYEKRSSEEKRLLLKHIFSNLLLNDRNVVYFLTKPAERIAKRVQERIDAKKFFEPSAMPMNKAQTPTSGGGLRSLLRDQDSNLEPYP